MFQINCMNDFIELPLNLKNALLFGVGINDANYQIQPMTPYGLAQITRPPTFLSTCPSTPELPTLSMICP